MSFKLPNNTIKWNSAPSVARYHLIDDLQESLVSLPLEANSRASSLVLLETLPTEIVSLICEWLQAKDLILLSCSCKSLYYAQSGKIDHHVIRDHLFRRLSDMWRAPDKMVHSLIATLSLQQIAQLIPLAKPLISGVRSDSSELCCSGNSALFLGHVGLGSRSVVACQPLPALDLAAASNELLPTSFMRSVCNAFGMLTCRQPSAYSAERCEGDFSFPLSLPLPLPLSFARLTSMGTSSSSDESPSQRLVSSASFAPSCSFSTPFLLGDKLLVAPRCVCYFEVSVVEVPVSEVVSGGLYGQANNDHGQGGGNGEGECVAVGLATRHFRGASKMPGWDANSFGLHGDDGALFHRGGHKLAVFSPRFGRGDTVGCGLDLVRRSIFFSLNGRLLGTAFTELRPGLELFPAAGVDCHARLDFNFGERPFQMDLTQYCS